MKEKIRLGVLGPEGTFGETAALKYRKKTSKNIEFVFFDSHKDIIDAFLEKKINQGLAAAENMINGTVREVLDLLYENNIMIKNEIILPINLCIAKNPKTKKIKRILSHPVALNQAKKYISLNFPGAKLCPVESTAKSMKIACENKDSAGIGTVNAAEKHSLKIIDKAIEDFKNNQTKFFVIAKKDASYEKNKNYKTFIAVYNKKDFPGLLYRILEPFAKKNINLSKIESRPTKRKLGTYIFFIEFAGHRKEKKINKVLKDIKNKITKLKIIGSYEAF